MNSHARFTLTLILALMGAVSGCTSATQGTGAGQAAPASAGTGHFHAKGQMPSKFTLELRNSLKATLPFEDERYQVRGFDLANISFIKGETGWIVFDPLTAQETARAALRFINEQLGTRPVVGVVYSHSHVDHFVAISMDPKKIESVKFTMNLVTPDTGEKYVVELSNATLTNLKGEQAKNPDFAITVNRVDLNQVMMGSHPPEGDRRQRLQRSAHGAGRPPVAGRHLTSHRGQPGIALFRGVRRRNRQGAGRDTLCRRPVGTDPHGHCRPTRVHGRTVRRR